MRKRYVWNWEVLDECTSRTRVIGGWLIRSRNLITGKQSFYGESMMFVADRDHEWEIMPPPEPEKPIEKKIPEDFQAK